MGVCINDDYSSIKALNYSVPQGSASGAYLFTAYCAPIESVTPAGIIINGLADDHSTRKSFIANSRDQEHDNFYVDGHSCNHSLLDGHYISEI